MKENEERVLLQSLQKRGEEVKFHEMRKWCDNNSVYRLPTSGWVVGRENKCISLNFTELLERFIKEKKEI